MNLITHNAHVPKKNMVALDRLVKLQKRANTRTLPILSVRTANSDSDKIFEVYFKNKNSTVNYAAKGFNYLTVLMGALNKYHSFNTQSNGMTNKATVDAKIADNVKRIIDSKFIPAINDAKMVVDSQAKKVYYIFGTFEHFVRVPYTDLIERKDVMGLLFKDFSISPTAKKIENTSSAKVSFSAESREFMPLSVWEKDKLPGSIALTTPNAIRPSAKEYPKEIAALPEFKVDLISIRKDSVYGMSNIINVADGIVSLEFAITLRFAYPLAYAFWAVYAKNNASFSIPNFFNLISGQILGSAGKQRADQSVPRLIPMQTSVDLLQERVSKLNLTQIPRINRNRFTILSDGTVYYIPEDGDLKKYDAVIKASYDVETKKVTPLSKIPEVKDKFLIADWVHNVAVYTNQSGAINTLDLIGAMAFEDRFVMRYFHQKDFQRAFSLDINVFIAMAVEVAKQININVEAIVGNIEGMTGTDIVGNTKSDVAHSDVNSVVIRVLTLTVNYPESTYEDIFTPESEIFKTEMSDNERMYVKVFSQVCNLIYKRLFAVNSHYALLTRMKYALPFYIFGIAAVRVGKYKEIYNKEAALNVKNATSYRSAMDMTVELPNMPGATDGLLPHQAAAYQSTIDKEPKLSVFDINAGGGKSLLIIIDIIKLLNDKKIKRPLILVPARLVSEFISEINKWGQGKINGYPLTSNSVIKLNKYLGYDRNKLLSDIRNAPPNTIFVASYSFLKVADPFKDVTSSKMQYGGTVVSFYPNTQFIRQGGFDLITMDEAHKLKNLSSQVSEATRSVVGDAEYRRIASGTIVYNTANDINGQIALLNPGILSDLDAAITENSVTDANGKIISVNEKLSKVLEDQMKPYVSRMVYRRRDWAFLLPPVTYTFLLCDMTPNLRTYYNKKVDELIEDLMKDPKIAKILESEDQEKIDKLMSSLDSNFAKMEILLNNPESDDVFANLATTKSEDLIPPKSKLVNAIIAAHFNGGTVTDVTGADATFVKSNAKIIVFGYNIAVSKGIYKYLAPEFKAMAVHYSSGNKDALIKFQQDPNIKIFVADETGVGTGFNFTFASHIIRLQSLWTPGAQEQAQSRILRADTKGQYNRERLYITQIMCRYSLDIAKCARNISKQVVGLQVTEGERPDWKRFENKYNLGPLPQIKMNLKLLRDKGEIRDVGEYFGAYQAIVKWDFEESKDITRGLISALAQKLNIPEDQVTLSMLRDQGRTKFVSNTTLEGTKSVFTPLVPNATILDKFGLGLQPLAIIKPGTDEDEDEDLEDVELEDNVAYAIDDMVVTEFGIGWIRGMRMGRENGPNAGKVTSVNIEIPGFQQYYKNTRNNGYVNLSLLEVFKPTNEDVAARVEARLTKLAEKNRGILFVKDGIAGINVDEILSKTKTPIKTLKPLPIEPKNVGKPKHPGANPNNNTDDDFDINDLIPADRTGKKPVKTVPTPDDTDDEVPLPKVTRPKDTTTRKIPKEPDEDVTPTKPTRVIVNKLPTPPQLDDKNRIKILNEFVKDPSKLFHYQKQTNTTSVVIDLSIINGEIAMATYPGEENFGKLEEATPATWYKVQPFVFVKIKTLQGAKNLAEKLENNFTLIDGFSDRLIKLAKAMQSKSRPQVEQNQKMDFSSLKNFVILNHTSSKVADALKGYPTVLDGYLYAIFPYPTQSKMANKLLNMRIQQCDKPTLNKTVTGYVFYRNKNKALEALDKIAKRLHVVNYSEIREKLKTDPEFVNFVNR